MRKYVVIIVKIFGEAVMMYEGCSTDHFWEEQWRGGEMTQPVVHTVLEALKYWWRGFLGGYGAIAQANAIMM